MNIQELKKKLRKKPSTTRKPIIGVATFQGPQIFGDVVFKEGIKEPNTTFITSHLTGLSPNGKHAIHIHEAGDLRGKGCRQACAHFNPTGTLHGGPNSKEHHIGDLGNLITNDFGENHNRKVVKFLKLRGKKSIIGRSVVIHALPDDLGTRQTKDSFTTGSAGARIGCAVIGYGQDSQLYF